VKLNQSGVNRPCQSLIMIAMAILLSGCTATKPSIQMLQENAREETARRRGETYRRLLQTTFRPQFKNVILRDVVRQLQREAGFDFVVHWDREGFGDGLDPESEIELVAMNDRLLIDVIEQVMRQATSDETTWNLGPGYVRLGLKDMLAIGPERYIVAYPIPWLLDHSPVFRDIPEDHRDQLKEVFAVHTTSESSDTPSSHHNTQSEDQELADVIINVLTTAIDPLQWEKNGGEGGSIQYLGGTLIVDAADFLHRQIGEYGYGASLAR